MSADWIVALIEVHADDRSRAALVAALLDGHEALVECPSCDITHRWPCPAIKRCDEPGCEAEADSGWPSDAGYRWTCHWHSDHYVKRRCNYPADDRHFAALALAGKEPTDG